MARYAGRAPIYKWKIENTKPEDGWVRISTYTNHSSVTQFKKRYPGFEFRGRKNPLYGKEGYPNEKAIVMEVRNPGDD